MFLQKAVCVCVGKLTSWQEGCCQSRMEWLVHVAVCETAFHSLCGKCWEIHYAARPARPSEHSPHFPSILISIFNTKVLNDSADWD